MTKIHPRCKFTPRVYICTGVYIVHMNEALDRRLNMSLTTKVKVAKFSFLNEKSYNKTVINFNFGRHKDLSILKSDIHLGLAASMNYHFFG